MQILNFIKNISQTEWIILILIFVVLLGRSTVVKLGKSGGETLKEIRNIKKNFTEAVDDIDSPQEKKEVKS